MNIDTPAGSKLRAAILVVFNLDDEPGRMADSVVAAALTDVLGAFAEMIASAICPALPMVAGVEMVADQTQEQILTELRCLRNDLAALRTAVPITEQRGEVVAGTLVSQMAALRVQIDDLTSTLRSARSPIQ